MKDILDKMTINEFDEMLEECGINEIRPTDEIKNKYDFRKVNDV